MTGRPGRPQLSDGDFWALQASADWSLPFELIDGEPVVIPLLSEAELAARVEVRWHLRRWQQYRGDDGLLVTATPVALADRTWLVPDLAYWAWERLPQRLGVAGEPAPDLVVFVKRTGTPDSYEAERRELARRAGAADAWTIEPERQRIQSARQGIREGKDMVVSPALPGFHMSAWQPFLTGPDSPARSETQLKHLGVVLAEHPDIRTAVLIGSVARDQEDNHSDLDLLIDLKPLTADQRSTLCERIEEATRRRADLKSLSEAMDRRASYVEDAIEHGVPLLDRDGTWADVLADPDRWRARAQEQRDEQDANVKRVVEGLVHEEEPGDAPGGQDNPDA